MSMKIPGCLVVLTASTVIASARPAAAQEFTAAAGNVSVKLTIPDGITKLKGVLAFTARGLASGWAGSAQFKDLAKRIEAGLAIVSGGDDLNDKSYPGRCASGEFNAVPDAFTKLAMMANHPELAHVPLVGLGHSHGGDYWNWFNACHPERMAMVFVHSSGGVNYGAAALKVPVFYTIGMMDLVERGSGMPRAGMFANRAKGAPMSLVLYPGGHDTQFPAEIYDLTTSIIEGIFKLRVPADADASKGPVQLNDIDESSGNYWVGDLYTKEISQYSGFKGNKALTSFLPSQELANRWKMVGPALPASIKLPADRCGWCGTPKDEPPAVPGRPAPPPPAGAPPAGAADAAAPAVMPPTPGTPPPTPIDPGGMTPGGGAVTPPTTPPSTNPPPSAPKAAAGGCSMVDGPGARSVLFLVALGLVTTLLGRRHRARR
jgi:hypothetical protein